MYYQVINDTCYIGSVQWEGSTSTMPSVNNITKLIGKGVINSDYSYYDFVNVTSIDFSNVKWEYKYMNLRKCSKLTDIKFPKDLSSIIGYEYYSTVYAGIYLSGCESLTSIDIPFMPNMAIADSMFSGCTSLRSVTLGHLPKLNRANLMFSGCTSLTSIKLDCYPALVSATNMFRNCTSLESIEIGDLPSLVDANSMCYNCTSLTNFNHGLFGYLRGFDYNDLKNGVNCSSAFNGCSLLTSIDLFDMFINNSSYMFKDCILLTDVSNCNLFCSDTSYMFADSGIRNLEIYNSYDGDINSSYMFSGSRIETITGDCIGKTCDNMFANCNRLTTINMPPVNNIKSNTNMFDNCINLVGGNGTKYNNNKEGSEMCVVDDSAHQGYLTFAKDRDLVNIDIKLSYFVNKSPDIQSYLFGLIKCPRVSYNGDTLKPEFISSICSPVAWIVVGSGGTTNVLLTDKPNIPVQEDLTIYVVPRFGNSASNLNAVIKAVANPQ